jgi:tetratricopeptide (TPR) repeat protein
MFARTAMLALLAVLATGPAGVAQLVTNTPAAAGVLVSTGASAGTGASEGAGASAGTVAPTGGGAAPDANADRPLPVPPVSPRLAEGRDYDSCLDMLYDDPQGASTFAESWASSGGGNGAAHCQALAQIELGNVVTGAEQLERLATEANVPDLTRAAVYGQAVQAWMMTSKPDRAVRAATLALSLSPNDADLLIGRADAEGGMEHYQGAIDDLNRALAIDPHRAEAFVLRASAWRHLNNFEVAASDIERALAINPDSAEALLERGILRQRAGDQGGARADWQRAINLDPNSTAADLAEQDLALLAAGPGQ